MRAPEPAPVYPALIGLDWGSTSLRAFLFGQDGRVVSQRRRCRGVLAIQGGDFAGALAGIVSDWHTPERPLPMLACGIIGSSEGWRGVSYVKCPAGVDELAHALHAQQPNASDGLHIVPGLELPGDL